jgi:hypothetical protein
MDLLGKWFAETGKVPSPLVEAADPLFRELDGGPLSGCCDPETFL